MGVKGQHVMNQQVQQGVTVAPALLYIQSLGGCCADLPSSWVSCNPRMQKGVDALHSSYAGALHPSDMPVPSIH